MQVSSARYWRYVLRVTTKMARVMILWRLDLTWFNRWHLGWWFIVAHKISSVFCLLTHCLIFFQAESCQSLPTRLFHFALGVPGLLFEVWILPLQNPLWYSLVIYFKHDRAIKTWLCSPTVRTSLFVTLSFDKISKIVVLLLSLLARHKTANKVLMIPKRERFFVNLHPRVL